MFKYTKSTILNSFALIKKVIYVVQLLIQITYIGYVTYRIVFNIGNNITNIILIAISVIYLLVQIFTKREFYERDEIRSIKRVKLSIRISKYLVNLYIIVISVIALINQPTKIENIDILMTILMILGLLSSIILDIVVIFIDNQINLINDSLLYDIERYRKEHDIQNVLLKKVLRIDLEKSFETVKSEKVRKRIKDINHQQKEKKTRKKVYFNK